MRNAFRQLEEEGGGLFMDQRTSSFLPEESRFYLRQLDDVVDYLRDGKNKDFQK